MLYSFRLYFSILQKVFFSVRSVNKLKKIKIKNPHPTTLLQLGENSGTQLQVISSNKPCSLLPTDFIHSNDTCQNKVGQPYNLPEK